MEKLNSVDATPKTESTNGAYYYDKTTGILTIKSKSFSPFKVMFDLPFAGGDGTKENPFLIDSGKQLALISTKPNSYFQLKADINVNDNDAQTYLDSWGDPNNAVITNLTGTVLDGDNHTIKYEAENGYLIGDMYNSTIKNLTVKFNSSDSSIVYYSENIKMDNVTVDGKMLWLGSNSGAFVIYPRSNVELTNCHNKALLQTKNGDESMYVSVFFGYTLGTGTISLTDCSNEGSLIAGKAGLIVANCSYSANTSFVLNNVKNNGLVQSLNKDFYNGAGKYNYLTADYWDKAACWNFTIDGKQYTVSTDQKWYDINSQGGVIGTGSFIAGPEDTTLGLKLKADGTFDIIPATVNGVDKYIVSVGCYVGTENGSARTYATEELSSTATVTTLKKLGFIDKEWINSHTTAEKGTLAGNTIYTDAGVSYYVVEDLNNFFTSGEARTTEMISITAVAADGTLLAVGTVVQPD